MSTELSQHPLHISYTHAHKDQLIKPKDLHSEYKQSEESVSEMMPQQNDEQGVSQPGEENLYGQEETTNESAEDLLTTINKLQEESRMFYSKWFEELSTSEQFELLCPSRIDELLKEALKLEEALIEQKQKIKTQLCTFTDLVKLVN